MATRPSGQCPCDKARRAVSRLPQVTAGARMGYAGDMRHILFLSLTALALTVTACAPARPDWHKAGATEAQTNADWYDCQRKGDAAVGYRGTDAGDVRGGPATDPLAMYDQEKNEKLYRRVVRNCMHAKGYVAGR